MFNSRNHHSSINPSQQGNRNGDVEELILQGDAIYDYERVPTAWSAFDEQPTVYAYGDAVTEADNGDQNRRSSKQ